MLLTIDLKGKDLEGIAQLLQTEAQQVQSQDFYFGKSHHWSLRQEDGGLQLNLLLDIDVAQIVEAEKSFLTAGPLMNKYLPNRETLAQTELAYAVLKVYTPLLSLAEKNPALSTPFDLVCHLPPLLGSEEVFHQLWGGMAYTLELTPLDGPQLYQVSLHGNVSLTRMFWDLIMLLPALDLQRYYWTPSEAMNEILLRLKEYKPQHPEPELVQKAYEINYDDFFNPNIKAIQPRIDPTQDQQVEDQIGLNVEHQVWDPDSAVETILHHLQELNAKSVLLLNGGKGELAMALLKNPQFEQITVMDSSMVRQQTLGREIGTLGLPPERVSALNLAIGTPAFLDKRWNHYDAVVLEEGFCELPPYALKSLEHNLFQEAQPASILLVVPNASHNPAYPQLAEGHLRHPRQRFSWKEDQLLKWANKLGKRTDYGLRLQPLGPVHQDYGAPAQLVIFNHLSQL